MSLRPWPIAFAALAGGAAAGCASASAPPSPSDVTMVRHVDGPTAAAAGAMPLGGPRCTTAACTCRKPGVDDGEREPPPPGKKRFELRLSADAGEATLDIAPLGRAQAGGVRDTCYYVDLDEGAKYAVTFTGRPINSTQGFTPRAQLNEYGPAGPFWYEILGVECAGGEGRCDRTGADRWGQQARRRKRGRVEACGSAVVSGLGWESTGAESSRDGGYFHDFTVRFTLEVKKFATQFPPGAKECAGGAD